MEPTWTKGQVYPHQSLGTIQFVASGEHRYLVHDNPAPCSMGLNPPPQLTVVQAGDTTLAMTSSPPGRRPGVVPLGMRSREFVCVGRRRRRFFWVSVEDLVQEGCDLLEPGLYFDTPDKPGAAPSGDVYGPFESMKDARLGAGLTFQDEKTPRRRKKAGTTTVTQAYNPWLAFERRVGTGPPADATCKIIGTIDLGGRRHKVWGCSETYSYRPKCKIRSSVYLFPSAHTRRFWPGAKASWYDAVYHETGCYPGCRTFVVYQGGVTLRERRRKAREQAKSRRPRPSSS